MAFDFSRERTGARSKRQAPVIKEWFYPHFLNSADTLVQYNPISCHLSEKMSNSHKMTPLSQGVALPPWITPLFWDVGAVL